MGQSGQSVRNLEALQDMEDRQKRHQRSPHSRFNSGFSLQRKLLILFFQATSILQANEKIYEVMKPGSVLKSIDWNQLASNNPLEDSLAIAKLCDNRSIRSNL